MAAKRQNGPATGPFTLAEQGSFFVGGRSIEAPGTFDPRDHNASLRDPAGQSFWIDQLYARYQIPVDARPLPLVFVHGSTQNGKTYETTPDGREGFETIFVRRGFSTYVVDFPRRGRAGYPSFTGRLGELAGDYPVIPDRTDRTGDRWSFTVWRLGIWPDFYPGCRFPRGKEALQQVFSQIAPDMTDDPVVIADALAALFDKIGPAILVTHSQSGLFGWMAAIRSRNVKAVVAFEPGGFVFPRDAMPPDPPVRLGLFIPPYPVPPDDFARLAEIPISITYGDHIPKTPSGVASEDFWQGIAYGPNGAVEFVDRLKQLGGDAMFTALPDIGIHGNTHFVIADDNNVEVADLMSAWLAGRDLD